MATRSTAPVTITGTRTGAITSSGGVTSSGYIRGGPEMLAALSRLEQGVKDELLAQATQAGADVLADEWKARVPVLDRNYQQGITASAKPGKIGATGLVRVKAVPGLKTIDQPYRYAARLEFGSARATKATLTAGRTDYASRGRAAQPSLRPAFDAVQGRMLDAMADEIRRLIERAT